MDVVTTANLETLIDRASVYGDPDMAAIESFWNIIKKERDGPCIGVRMLAARVSSPNERDALQALTVLDCCMKHCGSIFQAEVGKFRFLNELIKIVSPKYLGMRTPSTVRTKILNLMHRWTKEYPRETKIKEAFEMLKKQGVFKEDAYGIITPVTFNNINSPEQPDQLNMVTGLDARRTIFEDEEKSKLLQKLLRSKNPDDLQAANRLIKTMVKEDEKRNILMSKRSSELQTVHNNARLLSEMLDNYRPEQVSAGELELIKELYQCCERLHPAVIQVAEETQQNEEFLSEVLEASVALNEVFEKYKSVIIQGNIVENKLVDGSATIDSLLDLSTPAGPSSTGFKPSEVSKCDIDILTDIFNNVDTTDSVLATDTTDLLSNNILQPTSVLLKVTEPTFVGGQISNKSKAFQDLDVLSDTLLKESLTGGTRVGSQFNKSSDKTPLKMIQKYLSNSSQPENFESHTDSGHDFDLDYLVENGPNAAAAAIADDAIINLSDDIITAVPENNEAPTKKNMTDPTQTQIKSLNDIHVTLESIKPGSVPPLTVMSKNDITVMLYFAKDAPRPDVTVIVISTISKSSSPLSNYLFQAVVPKTCKLRLQSPSDTKLPAHNPFLPAAAITQVLLIANPMRGPVFLKFMISYTMDDETISEMGEVEQLPLYENI